MEQMVSEDLAYNILHQVNSLTNDLIRPSIPCPASAPAPGLAILSLPPRVEFTSSQFVMNQLTSLIQKHMTPRSNPWFPWLASAKMLPCLTSLGQWEFTKAHHSLMLRTALITNPDSSESILLDTFALPLQSTS